MADAYASTVTMVGSVNNTFAGLTDVQGGTLVLQQSNGGVARVAVPGDLVIGAGGTVRLAANEQIAEMAGNEVTVLAGGLLDVNTRTETLAKLLLDGGTATVALTGKLTAADAIVTGSTAHWTNMGDFDVGNSGNGTLDIAAGGMVSTGTASVGSQSGSTGTVSVDGLNSWWANGGALYVGNLGDGTLDITGGGKVTSLNSYIGNQSGSTGEVTVSGAGSTWTTGGEFFGTGDLYVGYAGDGTLQVSNSGQVNSFTGAIGVQSTSTGNVIVSDAIWTISFNNVSDRTLRVGVDGNGELGITDAGLVEILGGYCIIADNSSSVSSVTVEGEGSLLTTCALLVANFYEYSGGIVIGRRGNGTLHITNGGLVQTIAFSQVMEGKVEAWVGRDAGSHGTVYVDDAKWELKNSLHVGELGVGSVEIVNGGQVLGVASTVPFIAYLGYGAGSNGSLIVDGVGSLWSSDTLNVGYFGSGELSVTDGGKVEATNVVIYPLGEVQGDAELKADVQNHGLVSPGTSAARSKLTETIPKHSTASS